MPRQNRVDPFSNLIATPARGHFMGNRGELHDHRERIVRHHAGKRWLLCSLRFGDHHQTIMEPGRYTQLFFLDEVTALAAGHRPCHTCLRGKYEAFRDTWTRANPDMAVNKRLLADELDMALHAERLTPSAEKRTYREGVEYLPDGAFVSLPDNSGAYLVLGNHLLLWSASGYTRRIARPSDLEVEVLTPYSIVRTLAHGYTPDIDDSAYLFGT